MSQPAVAALAPEPFDFELVFDDGEPLESPWHRSQITFLEELLLQHLEEQRWTDVYVGANEFVYYSVEQARQVAERVGRNRPSEEVRGPDVFWVSGVDPTVEREGWVSWREGGRLPDVIFELFSKSNTLAHRKQKKELYSRVFRTAEYFVYGPRSRRPEGFRLIGGDYRAIEPDARGCLWSEQLHLFIGAWQGVFRRRSAHWIRFFRPDGSMMLTSREQLEQMHRL
ncbi:MAG TPA: Uma2 family endonuclease [Thermoanaerobaculia bacterium]|nr:Uma2 family endonuclease [Thermoanaerobaculia bacterium]